MMLLTDHRTINNKNNNNNKKNSILATKKTSLYFDHLLVHLPLKVRFCLLVLFS